jgi:hypothetical protein
MCNIRVCGTGNEKITKLFKNTNVKVTFRTNSAIENNLQSKKQNIDIQLLLLQWSETVSLWNYGR